MIRVNEQPVLCVDFYEVPGGRVYVTRIWDGRRLPRVELVAAGYITVTSCFVPNADQFPQ